MGRTDLLNLSRHVSERHVRKRILSHLESYDIELVLCAHNRKRQFKFDADFTLFCATHGHLKLLKWARKHDCPWHMNTCREAAEHGHVKLLKYAHANGAPLSSYTCTVLAERGDMDTLKWAQANKFHLHHSVCRRAALRGDIPMIQWAIRKGCGLYVSACVGAAMNGHLQTLKRLRELGAPWSGIVCDTAARNGHLHVLEWAHANGCRVEGPTVSEAARGGHIHVLQWLHDHHFFIPREVLSTCGDCIAVLEWGKTMFELSEYSDACMNAIELGNVQVLDWAKSQGFKFGTIHTYAASKSANARIVQWFAGITPAQD